MRRLNEPSHLDLRCLTFSLSTLHINVFLNDSLLKKKKKKKADDKYRLKFGAEKVKRPLRNSFTADNSKAVLFVLFVLFSLLFCNMISCHSNLIRDSCLERELNSVFMAFPWYQHVYIFQLGRYSETSLQRYHLFPKMLQLKWICCCKESLMTRAQLFKANDVVS